MIRNEFIDKKLEIEALQDIYGIKPKKNIYPDCRGKGVIDEFIALLRMVFRFYELPFKRDFFKKILLNQLKDSEISLNMIGAVLNLAGLKSVLLNPHDNDQLLRIPTPSIFLKDKKPIIIWEIVNKKFLVGDPTLGQSYLSLDKLKGYFKDEFRLLHAERTRQTPKNKFGLSWFWPSIKKHKTSLIQVVIASFFVQLLGLLNPLLIQQIIDAVITQGNFQV